MVKFLIINEHIYWEIVSIIIIEDINLCNNIKFKKQMKSKQNIYKKELNLKYFVVSLDLVKKKLNLHHLSELERDK